MVVGALFACFILSSLMPGLSLLVALAFLALLPWIMIRSWRYNALMSSYRGVRFNYHCRTGRACWTMYACLLLAVNLAAGSAGGDLTAMLLTSVISVVLFIGGLRVVQGIVTLLNQDFYQ